MKLTSLVAGFIAIAALSGCGGSDEPSASTDRKSGGGGEIAADISEGTSFTVETAARQLAKRYEATRFAVDDSAVTFTIDSAKPDETKQISNCQISTSVLDGIAAGEIDSVAFEYTDGKLTCAELLK